MSDKTAPQTAPVFLLGLGAQKAGTSWLWRYLSRHPQCSMGVTKEYGILDAVYRPNVFGSRLPVRMERVAAQFAADRQALKDGTAPPNRDEMLELMDMIGMELDLSRYVAKFDRLLRLRPGARLVGDITPEYCILLAPHLRAVKEMLTRAGYRLRVVYLMRDPVERCFSMFRMDDRNRSSQGKDTAALAHERLAGDALKWWCAIRTRYDLTVAEIEAALAPGEYHFDLYEDFITEAGVWRICDFLEIDRHPPNLNHRENVSPPGGAIAPADIAAVRAYYDPVYRFCMDRFGAERVARLWPHASTAG